MGLKHVQINTGGNLFFFPINIHLLFPWLLLFCASDIVQDSWKYKLFKDVLFQSSSSRKEQAISCMTLLASLL